MGYPPHFHVKYGDETAVIDIKTQKVTKGSLTRRGIGLVLDWTELHQEQLLEGWDLCQQDLMPKKLSLLNDFLIRTANYDKLGNTKSKVLSRLFN